MWFAEAMKIETHNSIALLIRDGFFFFPRKCREVFLIRPEEVYTMKANWQQESQMPSCALLGDILRYIPSLRVPTGLYYPIRQKIPSGSILISGATYTLINKLRSF